MSSRVLMDDWDKILLSVSCTLYILQSRQRTSDLKRSSTGFMSHTVIAVMLWHRCWNFWIICEILPARRPKCESSITMWRFSSSVEPFAIRCTSLLRSFFCRRRFTKCSKRRMGVLYWMSRPDRTGFNKSLQPGGKTPEDECMDATFYMQLHCKAL